MNVSIKLGIFQGDQASHYERSEESPEQKLEILHSRCSFRMTGFALLVQDDGVRVARSR